MDFIASQNEAVAMQGARASNAGDVFHELWALRCALRLLIPKNEIQAVTVEGIATPDASGYQYDGVDCGLFYGDTDIKKASRLEFVQLKYSTSDPSKAWTVARLCSNSAKKGDNSVLRKLAETFANARQQATPTARISIQLISNQPVHPSVLQAVDNIQHGDASSQDCARLITAINLSGSDLLEFLRILDFSQTGAGSREALLDALTFSVSEIINGNADTQVLVLQSRVRSLMLPGAEREKITLDTVLSWFGLSSRSGLFPTPPDLRRAVNPISRVPSRALYESMLKARLVCLHGPGGCGKTTTLMQVVTHLPPSSISVTFDCYGAGRYTHSNDRRHLPENAFLQIVNELAWEQETPFLMANTSTNPATIRTFLEKVERSAQILSSSSPDAILAILIDAADNSVAAAELSTPAAPCFIWELMQADLGRLPQNVRIVVSTRTVRKSNLRLPVATPEILCPAFTLEETQAFVRSRHETALDSSIEQFHALSDGIPRVQAYALANAETFEQALEALRPNGKRLDTVLREMFQSAAVKSGDVSFYERIVAGLATLPAPIPVSHLAAICQRSAEAVLDFIGDVRPSLQVEEASVTIADEDVEDFLNVEAAPLEAETLEKICLHFSTLFRTDRYAAIHYCDFLLRASRAEEILPIVERDLLPAGIVDPIERREVQLRRLRLALAACRAAQSAIDTVKVVLLSAEAAKDEDTFRDLLERETDLSVRFASSSLFRLILSDRDRYPSHGSILAQDASRAALAGDFVSARERLNAYRHWMERRREVSDNESQAWKVETDDVVALIESIAIMEGLSAARRAALRWRPVELWPTIAQRLVSRLLARGKRKLVEEAYQDKLLVQPWSLIFTVPLALSGYEISTEQLAQELGALRLSNVPDIRETQGREGNWKLPFLDTIVTACEIGFSRGVAASALTSALSLILNHRRSPSTSISRLEAFKIDLALRAWVMRRHLTGQSIVASEFISWLEDSNAPPQKRKRGRPKKKAATNRDRDDELVRTVNAIFPVYESRLEVLVEAAKSEINQKPSVAISGLSSDSFYFDRQYWATDFRRRVAVSIVSLMHVKGLSATYLCERSSELAKGKFGDVFADRSLEFLETLLLRPSLQQTVLNEITERADRLKDLRTGAKSKADALIKFSKLALHFSPADARVFFERAMEIVQEIDREAMIQIEFIASLATACQACSPDQRRTLATDYAAFVTDVAIRLDGEDHFPWEKATAALFSLAPEVGLAAISQWQDEGISDFTDTFPTALSVLSRSEVAGPQVAVALLSLLPRIPAELFGVLGAAARLAPKEIAAPAFEQLALHCLKHLPPDRRIDAAKEIEKSLPAGLATGPTVSRLRNTIRFCAEAVTKQAGSSEKRSSITFMKDADFSTPEGIGAAISEAWERYRKNYVGLGQILTAVRREITLPAQRIAYLDAVSRLVADSLRASEAATGILQALEEWRGGPAVESWRTSVLPRVIGSNLGSLSRWVHERPQVLLGLLEASGVDLSARVELIAQGLKDGSDKFSSEALFSFAKIMSPGLTQEGIQALASWYAGRLYQKVPPDIQGRYNPADIPPDFNDAIGRFLFAVMSDIDVRIRWRAAHCIRHLVAHWSGGILTSLFHAYWRTAEQSFRLPTAPFYWLAARLWLVMTVTRIAAESPAAAVPVATQLLKVVLDKDLPHYLIRANAKQALQTLVDVRALNLRSAELHILRAANRAKKPMLKVKRGVYRELEEYGRNEQRYKFDWLDRNVSSTLRHLCSLV